MPICTLIFFIQILRKFASSTMHAKEVCLVMKVATREGCKEDLHRKNDLHRKGDFLVIFLI